MIKFMEVNTMNIFKKTNNKETKKLPMTGKVKKGFRVYCAVVLCMALIGCMSMTAFAASGDPLTVINNLSDFISDSSVQSDLSCSASVLFRSVFP